MKSRLWVVAAVVISSLFLVAGIGMAQGDKDKVGVSEWSKVIESKVQDKVAEQTADGKGLINYEEGYIEAVGTGAPPEHLYGKPSARPMALRAAQVDAYRNLLEVVKGVQIDSQTVVKDFVTESDTINAAVSGIVKGAKVVNKEYLSDGTVEVTVRMGMAGAFTKTVIAKTIADDKKEDRALTPPKVKTKSAEALGEPVYTGMVVDARGLQAKPAMSPKVLDENGKVVYGTLIVNKDYAVKDGICGYSRGLEQAQSNQRVANNPVVVKGIRAEGAAQSDIIISNDDAQNMRKIKENQTLLQKCRVMIVLD